MHMMRFLRVLLAFSIFLLLGLLPTGCEDESAIQATIPPQFTGAFAGSLMEGASDIESRLGPLAGILATVNPSGDVSLQLFTLEGPAVINGVIFTDNRLVASGVVNGDRVRFTGEWDTSAGFARVINGNLRNLNANREGAWQMSQAGPSAANLQGAYNGSYSAGTRMGSFDFFVAADGAITGFAGGLGASTLPVTGTLGRNNQLYATANDGTAIVAVFIGAINPETRAVTGTVASDLDGGIFGTWEAEWGT